MEKVIRALRICSVQNDVGCQGCPYFEERKTYGHEWCTTSMAHDTLAMIKEHDAVKIEVKKINNSGRCGRCPNCLMELNEVDYPNYCGNCGQAVKWE